MHVSVIIATYNRCALLMRTLPPLLEQQFPKDQYEVLVVVDGSTDRTREFLRGLSSHTHLRVLEQTNCGQAAAINAGLKAAKGELVLFLDDDIICGPSLIAEHAGVPRDGKTCLAFGPVLVSQEGQDPLAVDWAATFCDRFFETNVHESPEQGWYGCMASANSSLPRKIALSIGGLDETFSRGNDVEFGFRLLNAGYRFVYEHKAITRQIFRKTPREIIADAAEEGIAEIRLCRKYPELRSTSRFATLSSRPWWKRAVAHALATAPLSLEPLLRPFTRAVSMLRLLPFCRRFALRLFQAQQNITAYRSAVGTAGSWQALLQEFGARLPILMYHNIGPLRERFDEFLTISPRTFERHLRWLRRKGFTTIHISDWIAYQRDGKPLPEKPVLLTFDDGYRDTAEFGFPLLQKYGCKGTLFLVTDHIGGTNIWDLPLGVSEQPLMTTQEIQHWASVGIEIGSHTRTHPDLRVMPAERIAEEMRQSKERLEQLLGVPVIAFAYPYGYFTNQTVELAREFFHAALTCEIGINQLATDPMVLKRATVVPRYTWWDMPSYVRLGYNVLLVVRTKLSIEVHRLLDRIRRNRDPAVE